MVTYFKIGWLRMSAQAANPQQTSGCDWLNRGTIISHLWAPLFLYIVMSESIGMQIGELLKCKFCDSPCIQSLNIFQIITIARMFELYASLQTRQIIMQIFD